ncbi:MAG: RecT family recombinase [Defluviitoga tunisiensis]
MSKEIEKTNEMQEYSNDKIELIKRTYAKGSTDDEFALLLELSKRYNLDPFKKQIFYIPGTGVLVSHAGLIHIAHQSGYWAGMKTLIITKTGEEVYVVDDNKNISGAVCYIYRKDWNEPLVHAVSFQEYIKPSRTGYPGAWERMPQTMIKKVAEAGALRRAFDLGGLYIEEEMDTYTVYDEQEENIEEGEEKETKVQKKSSAPNVYLARLYSNIQAFSKKYEKKEQDVAKYLEKKIGKEMENFNTNDIKKAIEILKQLIEKEKAKEKQKDFEIVVEEPVNKTNNDEIKEWQKKLEETFADLGSGKDGK